MLGKLFPHPAILEVGVKNVPSATGTAHDIHVLGVGEAITVNLEKPTPPQVFSFKGRDGCTSNIKSEWFNIFPWLVYDKDELKVFCNCCKSHKMNNVFGLGKSTTKIKKDDLTKHSRSASHRNSVQIVKQSKDMKIPMLILVRKKLLFLKWQLY